MDKRRGHGSRKFYPYWGNPVVGRQNAKRHRLVNAGLAPTKDELAELAADAVRTHPIKVCPMGQRTIKPEI